MLRTVAVAVASRVLSALLDTSTIWAVPSCRRWVRACGFRGGVFFVHSIHTSTSAPSGEHGGSFRHLDQGIGVRQGADEVGAGAAFQPDGAVREDRAAPHLMLARRRRQRPGQPRPGHRPRRG